VNARVDHTVTSGTFSLDGQTHDVENNVWVAGEDTECAEHVQDRCLTRY
jgi:hydroxyacylglutathione hydrolase